MRVLLIGSGGREHALALALAADAVVEELAVAPGNPGMAAVASRHQACVTDPAEVLALAQRLRTDLVVVGPEAPLVAGVADALREHGIACFGPSAAAARLEGSKAFAKEVMATAGVPTALARVCVTLAEVEAALGEFGAPYVVKNDGLAAGKGVLVTRDWGAATAHALACGVTAGGVAGDAGVAGSVVIEEFLDGPEVSLFVITDGEAAVPLLPAQDFKRIGDGDTGPNTGGMGAYCPLPWAPPDLTDVVMSTVVQPTLAELRRRGAPFVGLLYVGLALTSQGPRVVEFNARLGDPDGQAALGLLETPLAGLLYAAATGTLAQQPPLRWRCGACVVVVMAAQGYPGTARTGDVISGADRPGILHAGTALRDDGAVVTAGGRVINCVGRGSDVASARAAAYALVDGVHFDGAQSRRDIAALGQ